VKLKYDARKDVRHLRRAIARALKLLVKRLEQLEKRYASHTHGKT
jgi:hypothetical protein